MDRVLIAHHERAERDRVTCGAPHERGSIDLPLPRGGACRSALVRRCHHRTRYTTRHGPRFHRSCREPPEVALTDAAGGCAACFQPRFRGSLPCGRASSLMLHPRGPRAARHARGSGYGASERDFHNGGREQRGVAGGGAEARRRIEGCVVEQGRILRIGRAPRNGQRPLETCVEVPRRDIPDLLAVAVRVAAGKQLVPQAVVLSVKALRRARGRRRHPGCRCRGCRSRGAWPSWIAAERGQRP